MTVHVSVIVPCHDAARYIDEALASVAAQGVPDLEVLVIDDGSTDDSAAVAARHGGAVRVHSQPNAGAAAARNRGLELARGALVAFLDADDVWTPNSLGDRLAALDAEPDAGYAAGLVQQFVSPDFPAESRSHLAEFVEVSAGRVAGGMLVRRSVIESVGHFDAAYRSGEVIDWVARADAAGVRAALVPRVVLRRRIHAANSTRRNARLPGDYLRMLRSSIARQRPATDVTQ